jgi:hypothetical protein
MVFHLENVDIVWKQGELLQILFVGGDGGGSFHYGSRQKATLNLPEHSSATVFVWLLMFHLKCSF